MGMSVILDISMYELFEGAIPLMDSDLLQLERLRQYEAKLSDKEKYPELIREVTRLISDWDEDS